MASALNLPTVVLEPAIEAHDPELYAAEIDESGADGFGAVDSEELANYRDRGFLVVRRAFAADSIRDARDELLRMARSDAPQCESVHYEGGIADYLPQVRFEEHRNPNKRTIGRVVNAMHEVAPDVRARYVRKLMGFCATHRALAALAENVNLKDILQRIVGEPVRLYQEMALVKPPGGREKPWHQDHSYFNLPLDSSIVGVWIALDDVRVDNGCMVVLPKGQKKGPRTHFMRRDYQICDSEIQEGLEPRVALPMHAGDLLLFDGKLPHGTPTNNTQEHRWAVQFHYVGLSVQGSDEIDYRDAFGSEEKDITC